MNKLWIVAICLLLAACGSNKETPVRTNGYEPVLTDKQDSLEHDVLDGHDQAMARIAKLSKTSKKVQEWIDSLSVLPSSKKDLTLESNLKTAKRELGEAQQAMNEWMDGFRLDSLKENKTARIQYLESELVKVNQMKNKIISALSKSDSILKN